MTSQKITGGVHDQPKGYDVRESNPRMSLPPGRPWEDSMLPLHQRRTSCQAGLKSRL